jgi:hypothetical protein
MGEGVHHGGQFGIGQLKRLRGAPHKKQMGVYSQKWRLGQRPGQFRFGPVCGHKSDIFRGLRSAISCREQMQQNRMRHRKIAVLRGSLRTGSCHVPSPADMMEDAVVFGQ